MSLLRNTAYAGAALVLVAVGYTGGFLTNQSAPKADVIKGPQVKAEYTFKLLGTDALNRKGSTFINNNGVTVVNYVDKVYDTNVTVTLPNQQFGLNDKLNAASTAAYGISNTGLVVGQADAKAFVYDINKGAQNIAIPGTVSHASAVSGNGLWVAGVSYNNSILQTWILNMTTNKLTWIPAPYTGANLLTISQINNNGIASGYWGTSGYKYDANTGVVTNLSTTYPATAIDMAGDIAFGSPVVGNGDISTGPNNSGSVLTPAGKVTSLGFNPYDINANEAVGTANGAAQVYKPAKGTQDLNTVVVLPAGLKLTEADSINDNGQIVGLGSLNGRVEVFELTPLN